LDATVGSNGLAQGREFAKAAGVTGLVLTKLDGTAKGGAAVAVVRELGVPIRYVGVGEALEDLLPFDAAAFADSLLTD
jgi:fused signal recognition particle receptor